MEVWKGIKGYENYEVSNKGRVRSIKYKKPYIHKERLNKDGYVKATLSQDGKQKDFRVHRLVALHFIENPNNLETVNHINGIKTDNRVENLEWLDRSDQLRHAYKLGLKVSNKGSKSYNASFTDDEVRYIRKVWKPRDEQFGAAALSRKFGVWSTTIDDVVNFKTYTNVK